jgi:hypothetical protein
MNTTTRIGAIEKALHTGLQIVADNPGVTTHLLTAAVCERHPVAPREFTTALFEAIRPKTPAERSARQVFDALMARCALG